MLRKIMEEKDSAVGRGARTGIPHIASEQIDPETDSLREVLAHRAKTALLNRKRRRKLFESSMFGEPAWDMLLILYVNDWAGARQTIARLTETADVTGTTALRWIEYLEQENLIVRGEHPTDRRAVLIHLTEEAREALDKYFSELR